MTLYITEFGGVTGDTQAPAYPAIASGNLVSGTYTTSPKSQLLVFTAVSSNHFVTVGGFADVIPSGSQVTRRVPLGTTLTLTVA